MNIVLIEPFFTGSHKQWALGYKHHSKHNIDIISLKGIFWKWRMHGGAVTLSKMFNEYLEVNKKPDLIIVTDMLNLPVFTSLANVKNIPIISFFHENQITYPWSTQDRDKEKNRDHHYGFINYTTALRSDLVMFNSYYHKNIFIKELRKFLKKFPDNNDLFNVDIIEKKSVVSYLGLDLEKFDQYKKNSTNQCPIILWNHRWEYDKNPEEFFECLKKIKNENIKFKLIILGEEFQTEMDVFTKSRKYFSNEIIHMGYAKSFSEYASLINKSDILPVTTKQEFFGVSVIEAIYCGVFPILPKRLTYPELFNSDLNPDNFYQDSTDLFIKLKECIVNNTKKSLREYSNRYKWSKIAKDYDNIIQKVIK
tara:strand:- start:8992 stop:10089 length:1098 start_codon:yes stop_codon:yes gene_type:complete